MYVQYHDTEWGRPERDPKRLFELLMLEGFQAGLSWLTILRRREGFRQAFAGFAPEILENWGEAEVKRLLADPGIIRHRGKIEATLRGAKAFLQIEAETGFAPFVWGFVGGETLDNRPVNPTDVPAQMPQSIALSKALKAQGFAFVGPTITYAFMQAAGLVNDHLVGCPARNSPLAFPGSTAI